MSTNCAIEEWEADLDMLGPFASYHKLVEMRDKAPIGAPSLGMLNEMIGLHESRGV